MAWSQREAVVMEEEVRLNNDCKIEILGNKEGQPSILSQFFHRLKFFKAITAQEEAFLLSAFEDYVELVNWWDLIQVMTILDELGLRAINYFNGYNPIDFFIGEETDLYHHIVAFECAGVTLFQKVSNNCRLAHRIVLLAIIFKT